MALAMAVQAATLVRSAAADWHTHAIIDIDWAFGLYGSEWRAEVREYMGSVYL